MLDLLVRDAHVVDGTGAPARVADVGVAGDRIVHVGRYSGQPARRTVLASGAVLAPGFIDLHSHGDFTLPAYPRADSMIRQGVTTVVTGNCGLSPFPVPAGRRDEIAERYRLLDAGLSWDWSTLAEYAESLGAQRLATNVALQIGHSTLRMAIGLEDNPPDDGDLAAMRTEVGRALREGAYGLSSGLIYAPSCYADTDELVELCRPVGAGGGFYSTHIRGEADTVREAVAEALEIGRRAAVPVQLSHHKAKGRRNWGAVRDTLAMVDEARAAGQDVLADQYPYSASSTGLWAFLPGWAKAGSGEQRRRNLADPERRRALRRELAERYPEAARPGGRGGDLDGIVVTQLESETGRFADVEGERLVEIADRLGVAVIDAVLDLLADAKTGVQVVDFAMSEDDVRLVLTHPAVAIGSDARLFHPDPPGVPHPRNYAAFTRVLTEYVHGQGLLTLEQAVWKMTGLAAQRLGWCDRGLIREGYAADLVLLNPDRLAERSTFADPRNYSTGVDLLLVNGIAVVERDEDTGAAAGRVLRRGHPHACGGRR